MVCMFGASLAVAGIALSVSARRCRRVRRAARSSRCAWGVAALLAGSALLLMAAPRADQPLLDAAEYALPSLRTLYLNGTEAATYEDARRYAERYRRGGGAAERDRD